VTAQTNVYIYNQRQLVVLLNPALPNLRYEKVYSKNLTVSRGVDNILEFTFIDQNQKPVNITGKEITCRILNANGTKILLQKTLVPLLPLTGITSLQLDIGDLEGIDGQSCFYSLEIPVGAFDYPVFVDSQGGARGVINIVNSVLPSFVESKVVTIPSHPQPDKINDNVNPEVQPAGDNGAKTYYSSVVNTVESPLLTLQLYYNQFTGNIQFEGSTLADFAFYYQIGPTEDLLNISDTRGYNIEGYHPYVRVKIKNYGTPPPVGNDNKLQGDVTAILAR
jgi:hypothetical protein